jgi:hypothetical protein
MVVDDSLQRSFPRAPPDTLSAVYCYDLNGMKPGAPPQASMIQKYVSGAHNTDYRAVDVRMVFLAFIGESEVSETIRFLSSPGFFKKMDEQLHFLPYYNK